MLKPLVATGFLALAALSAIAQTTAPSSTAAALEKSPRHQEWVTVKHGDRAVQAFAVYPERKDKAPVVILIHENRGLTDWVRSVADRLAAEGYVAVAPDLLSGAAPGGGRTSGFPSEDAAREAISKLAPDQVTADLDAVADWAAKVPAGNGKVAVAGFCWGGGQTFRYANHRPDLDAAFVFYGSGPDMAEEVAGIRAPVYGFYGGDDARIGATVPKSAELMKQAGKRFEPVTYAGAGHGFLRAGEEPDASAANKKAREEAWKRWLALLKKV